MRKMGFAFENSYAALPERFFVRQEPAPSPDPQLVAFNRALAYELGFNADDVAEQDILSLFSGNAVPEGAATLAQAYAGHQFGNFVPQLGDGRALLLGEVVGRDGQRRDIQLKGSGPTAFSRGGDGRAVLGPVLREYILSEAMHALNVPTTRALAAVTTGAPVLREEGALPGAILTRVAASHLRVGTFQYFYARGDLDALRQLSEYAVMRHYPDASGETVALTLLRAVIERQAWLVARWMQLGFIHGVMNTDNCTISGETIDYGPCAFMDTFEAGKVFSSIDHYGRYAWGNQGRIAHWNMAQLGQALLPMLHEDEDKAVHIAQEAVDYFPQVFHRAYVAGFAAKLGLPADAPAGFIDQTLQMLEAIGADYTNFWRGLSEDPEQVAHMLADPEPFRAWRADWQALSPDLAVMAQTNPAIIPRNHMVQKVLSAAQMGDFEPFNEISKVLAQPFDAGSETEKWRIPPTQNEEVTRTFCGT